MVEHKDLMTKLESLYPSFTNEELGKIVGIEKTRFWRLRRGKGPKFEEILKICSSIENKLKLNYQMNFIHLALKYFTKVDKSYLEETYYEMSERLKVIDILKK